MSKEIYIKRLEQDLIGPADGHEETINEKPSDKYLSGILYPLNTKNTEEEDNGEIGANTNDGEESFNEEIEVMKTYKPSSLGLSFRVPVTSKGKINVHVKFGKYTHVENKEKESTFVRKENNVPLEIDVTEYKEKTFHVIENVKLHVISNFLKESVSFTISLLNNFKKNENHTKIEIEEMMLFQASIRIISNDGFVEKNTYKLNTNIDDKINSLIYRNIFNYASGHTCSADYKKEKHVKEIFSTWMPVYESKKVIPDGDEIFHLNLSKIKKENFSSKDLSELQDKQVLEILKIIPDSYSQWLDKEKNNIKDLKKEHQETASRNFHIAEKNLLRMREGIDFLKKDTENLDAFRLAQKSLLKQFNWSINSSVEILNWRPFQLAFFLINIAYLDNPEHPDRETMDLLWFPTGGGKTEAYLLIISFIIFYRRLSKKVKIKSGLTVLMRYTLRTLTIDQFKRAFSLIIACEQIRINEINNSKDEEISIGLWVGGKTTPNKPNDITDNDEITAKQIDKCPSCKNTLSTFPGSKSSEFFCENKKCELTDIRPFPFYAMDTTIYEKKPTLVIGTVDKFAQIVRNKALSNMFTSNFSPDLIIQDELHLISGPMGSLSGIYEFAIDTIFSLHKKIKIIGSTATIKRAEEQIRSLYNRNSNQFPPSIINIDNSCFAKVDKISPGRFYTGVSTAGRSAKFILQFMTSSFLQSIKDKKISNKEIDYYSSIVLYFNSLRELGGTIALVEDDVRKSLDVIAERRDEDVRYPENIQELTSRRSSKEINETLDNLRQSFKDINFVDILLATNMLSVGVDIPRLGLMLVNGYPKSMAEYIQSTSRVGRKHSGVIATLFNHNKVRDKSIYENFSYVHETLYKSVEVSSLTPFSPRSRDKSIHAPIVAIYRILYSKSASAKIFDNEAILIRNKIIKPLYERIKKIDIKECEKAREECEIFLNHWLEKSKQKKLYWWNPSYPKNSLLISAEQNATKPGYNIGGYEKSGSSNDEPPSNYSYPTPNSMRDVEPSVGFKIVEQ